MVVSNKEVAAYVSDKTGFRFNVIENIYKDKSKHDYIFSFPNETICFEAREKIERLWREDKDEYFRVIKEEIDPNILQEIRRKLREAKGEIK